VRLFRLVGRRLAVDCIDLTSFAMGDEMLRASGLIDLERVGVLVGF
jgi:hypothetical protein